MIVRRRRAIDAIAATLLVPLLPTDVRSANRVSRGASIVDFRWQTIAKYLRSDTRLLVIRHLPDAVQTRGTLTIRDLEKSAIGAEVARIDDRSIIDRTIDIVSSSEPKADLDLESYDARWALYFDGATKRNVLSFDAFGSRGAIDGRRIRFANPSFVSKLLTFVPNMIR